MSTLATELPRLTAHGIEMGAAYLGLMRESQDLLDDMPALRDRMSEDGYVLLRGLLDPDQVMDARRVMTQQLAAEGSLAPGTDPINAIACENCQLHYRGDLQRGNEPLRRVLKSGRMMEFFDRFLGGPSLCFDYTWIRALAPGHGTNPHCDVVYMGRGTHNLFTAWTPLGPATFETGGLILLEGSHRNPRLRQTYCQMDVDTYCTNRPPESKSAKGIWAKTGGGLTHNVNQLQRSLGGRWLANEFEPGDVVVFSVYTVHAGSDNHSRRIRLSSDTRYQLASEPTDERWMGENPVAHGPAGKRGRIC